MTYSLTPVERRLRLQSFEQVLQELEQLKKAPDVLLSPGWDLPHIFDHCARSIELSMSGFPEMKSALFRNLIGQTAFHVFDTRGYMRHPLDEEIPGSEYAAPTMETALERLETGIRVFLEYEGRLMPHFAYGRLSKQQYERAHAMHIANHLGAMEY